MHKSKIYIILILTTAFLCCTYIYFNYNKEKQLSNEKLIILEWNELVLKIEGQTHNIYVPVSARFFGFFGFIPYLSIYKNMGKDAFIKNNFADLILPENDDEVDAALTMNTACSEFIKKYYVNLSFSLLQEIDDLESKWEKKIRHEINPDLAKNSVLYAEQIATALFNWSKEDYYSHQAYIHGFNRDYNPPKKMGKWVENEDHPMPALLPFWGSVCPLLINLDNYHASPLPEFSNDRSSIYYRDALEVFTISSPLSRENKWIAEFWSDDVRGLTFSPAARWISILCQFIRNEDPDLHKCAEAFLKVGIGMADATIACWHAKYLYNLERPESYIRRNIQSSWRPYHESPNFPAYPSGHSTLGGVSSEILTHIFGDKIDLKDNSHKDRQEFIGKPRSFSSFNEMALENAYSRIPLGVHFRMDIQEGLRLGSSIGKEINRLKPIDVNKPQ